MIANYKNSKLSPEKRANDLLHRMTLQEKIGQTVMEIVCAFKTKKEACKIIGKGQLGSLILSNTAFPGNAEASGIDIEFLNDCQKAAIEQSRLGIPLIFGRDIIHGHYTVAPIPLAQAASFNPQIAYDAAAVSAKEAAAESVHWTFAPMMDISRDPRWGRCIEGFGEDPYLASEMAVAAVRGYQDNGLVACAKHFAGYGYAEGGRDYDCCEIDNFTMQNTVLAPFRAAVKRAHVASIMAAYQVKGGQPVSGDSELLNEILRKQWEWDGCVVSDFSSVAEIGLHGAAQNPMDAARKGMHAGVAIEMCNDVYPKYLEQLIQSGRLSEVDLDKAVYEILLMKFRAGLFEHPYNTTKNVKERMMTAQSRVVVKTMATEGCVLTRNAGNILPFDNAQGKKIALIGPMVHERHSLMGAWKGSGRDEDVATLAEAFKEMAPKGCQIIAPDTALQDAQLRAAYMADLIVCCVGESADTEGEAHCTSQLSLPAGQEEFIKAAAKLRAPVVVMNFSGRPLPSPAAEEVADAILYLWQGGTEAARAAAEIFFGKAEPTGRFPISVPRSVGQCPIYYGRKLPGKVSGEWLQSLGYRYYDDCECSPLYPFGYGLGYTEFEVSPPKLARKTVKLGENNKVTVKVTNIGRRAGTTVVQAYLRDPAADYARPAKELFGFMKINLDAGKEGIVSFDITPEAMGYFDKSGNFIQETGIIQIGVGLDSDIALDCQFEVK